MAAIVRARNELVRVAFALDPPQTIGRPRRMSTLETIQLIVYMCRAGCPWSIGVFRGSCRRMLHQRLKYQIIRRKTM